MEHLPCLLTDTADEEMQLTLLLQQAYCRA